MGSRDTGDELPKVLMVDDEQSVADAYALRLEGVCNVDTVYNGESALEHVEGQPTDILLLDRHMPGLSGDDVLDRLTDRPFDGRVIMVTAIDPGFDVLDMPFDDYLCKPLTREDLRAAVEQQCTILGYETLGEYFSVESKRSVLEAELPADERTASEDYVSTKQRSEKLEQRVRRLLDTADDLFETFDTIEREGR